MNKHKNFIYLCNKMPQSAVSEEIRRVDQLVDDLLASGEFDIRRVWTITEELAGLASGVSALTKAKQAGIARLNGYESGLSDNESMLGVYIEIIEGDKRRGYWIDFEKFMQGQVLPRIREESARHALRAVELYGMEEIGPNFQKHLQYGLYRGLFGRSDIDAAQVKYNAVSAKR